jgi:hypothetical protein
VIRMSCILRFSKHSMILLWEGILVFHRRLPERSKESALCASSICHHHLSLPKPTSIVLDQSEAVIRLAIDATTAPDGSSSLHMQHNIYPVNLTADGANVLL